MNLERDPSDTESCLELLLNTLCRNFKMKPKQAAALLTNNNQYLVHSVVKGVKGRFEPVVAWYQEVYANSKHLSSVLEVELTTLQNPSTNLDMVMNILKSGLCSHNHEVASWTSRLLAKLAYDFYNDGLQKQAF